MKTIRGSNRRQRGFTLTELIIAMALFAFVGTGVMFALNASSKTILSANEITTAESMTRTIVEFVKRSEYDSGITTTDLNEEVGNPDEDDEIDVDDTTDFPDSGVIQIGSELIYYASKDGNSFNECERGYVGTTTATHSNGTAVINSPPYYDDTVYSNIYEAAVETVGALDTEPFYGDYSIESGYANNFDDGYLEFAITGFRFPEDTGGDEPEGILTCFVGEGDPHYGDYNYGANDVDYIEVNGQRLPCVDPPDPYDDTFDPDGSINPKANVWNGTSSVPGAEGSGAGEGIDIDAFLIKDPVIEAGDTAATLRLDTGVDIWNIVYIFLSIETVPTADDADTPVAINTFGFGGQ